VSDVASAIESQRDVTTVYQRDATSKIGDMEQNRYTQVARYEHDDKVAQACNSCRYGHIHGCNIDIVRKLVLQSCLDKSRIDRTIGKRTNSRRTSTEKVADWRFVVHNVNEMRWALQRM
jgi:hypothetical protein